jgi:hypothetical protein
LIRSLGYVGGVEIIADDRVPAHMVIPGSFIRVLEASVAQDQNKTVTSRRWVLEPVDSVTPELWVRHTTVVRDVGLPGEITEHTWEAELVLQRNKIVVAVGSSQAEFDTALNTWRQAIVDARSGLGTM